MKVPSGLRPARHSVASLGFSGLHQAGTVRSYVDLGLGKCDADRPHEQLDARFLLRKDMLNEGTP